MTSASTAPLPNPDGKHVYKPRLTGQASIVRQEISQGSWSKVGLQISKGEEEFVDPESFNVTIFRKDEFTNANDPYGAVILTLTEADITREKTGVYSFTLDPSVTEKLCLITVHWEYTLEGQTFSYWDYYEVLTPMPTYNAMNDGEKGIIRLVSNMFSDLYDATDFGPYLREPFQSHFGSERIAQCMEIATNRINTQYQPYTHYNVGEGVGKRFPAQYYSILMMATYLEVIRHLIRSYTEEPQVEGGPGVAYLSRRDYADRWRAVLKDEEPQFEQSIKAFKRSLLNLGGGSLLVAGGIYGQAAYWRSSYNMQVRGGRFYPVSFVQTRP